jgi:hypothetical protein
LGTLFGFVVGYLVGSRGGPEHYDELVTAFRKVRQSREIGDLWVVIRREAWFAARQLSLVLAGREQLTGDDLVARARARAEQG